jgi:hypothetical protein
MISICIPCEDDIDRELDIIRNKIIEAPLMGLTGLSSISMRGFFM